MAIFKNQRKLKGGIEHLFLGHLTGWLFCEGEDLNEVNLYFNNDIIAKCFIDIFRPDISKLFSKEGNYGFRLDIPPNISAITTKGEARLIVRTKKNKEFKINLLEKPEETNKKLKLILESNLTGLNGHVDGLQDGVLHGWAGKKDDDTKLNIWLNAIEEAPIKIHCGESRNDIKLQGISKNAGFRFDTKLLPKSWKNKKVWCTFDKEGFFYVPQNDEIILIKEDILNNIDVLEKNDINFSIKNKLTKDSKFSSLAFKEQWNQLDDFKTYLDKVENNIDRFYKLKNIKSNSIKKKRYYLFKILKFLKIMRK